LDNPALDLKITIAKPFTRASFLTQQVDDGTHGLCDYVDGLPQVKKKTK